MTRHSRSPLTSAIALAVAFAVAAAGRGVPMCATLLAHLVTPCAMHAEHSHAGTHDSAVSESPADDHGCHTDRGHGCASLGACPAGAAAVVGIGRALLSSGPVGADAEPRVLAAPPSFVAPPAPPPPQA